MRALATNASNATTIQEFWEQKYNNIPRYVSSQKYYNQNE